MNDQIFMKEQLLRLNAINDPSSGSDVKSASSSSFSSSPAVIASNDVPSDEEFVDEYCPAPRAKPAKKKRTWSDSSLKLLALLKSEQNTVDQARKSTSNIFIRSVSLHFAVAWLLLSRAKQERKVKQRCNSSERSDRSAFKRLRRRENRKQVSRWWRRWSASDATYWERLQQRRLKATALHFAFCLEIKLFT